MTPDDTDIKLASFNSLAESSKKQESSRKTSISALLTMPKLLTVWITEDEMAGWHHRLNGHEFE